MLGAHFLKASIFEALYFLKMSPIFVASEVVRTLKYFTFSYTGCKSPNYTFLKINILKESLLLVKQTIPQQKAIDLSFNLAP